MTDRFTEQQIFVMAILPSIVSPLSIIGSSGIIYMLYIRGESRMYHRLMFTMSVLDILVSGMAMFGPMPVPKKTGAFMARGNIATCSAQGFFMQLSISNGIYNSFLMLSFLLIIRYGWKEEDVASRYEKRMHGVTICGTLVVGIVCIALGLYNPVPALANLRCYIAAYPGDCEISDDVVCTRGETARIFFAFFCMIPALVFLVVLFGSTFTIWWTVFQNDRQTRHPQYNVRNTSGAVAVQSAIYGIFFFNTYVWLLLDALIDLVLPPSGRECGFQLALRFLGEVFYWSQGFFNFMIYVRPRYVQIRSLKSSRSALWAMKETVFGNRIEEIRASAESDNN